MVSGGKHSQKNKPHKQVPVDPNKAAESAKSNEKWDEVSEASWESFPASDPPSWTMRRPADPPKKPRDQH